MIIEQTSGLGKNAINNPKNYNGFFGISIPHKFFSKVNMRDYFLWCFKYFNKTSILLMDDPEHYNFMAFKNMSKQEALSRTRSLANQLKRAYEKILRDLKINSIKIVQFRDFDDDEKYKKFLKEISYYFQKNSRFRENLINLMQDWIGGKVNECFGNLNQSELEEKIKILSKYILEEFVSIIYFTESGFPIEIDPTPEFPTKKMLYEGEFPELYKELDLTQRGHIFVYPKGQIKPL